MPVSSPRRVSLGGLSAIDFPAEGRTAIICFHGYGADAADLASLARELALKRPARWLFPDAPLPLDAGPFPSGRMWFPIDMAAIEEAQRTGVPRDLSGLRHEGLDEAAARARAFLDALETPWEDLILGGFSQGAMLALELALGAPVSPRGVFILSGNLFDEQGLRARAPARAGLPFFQSHGTEDLILGYRGARRLEAALREAGWRGELVSFPDGHTLSAEAVAGLTRFLDGLLG